MRERIWDGICVAVVVTILSLGLWPFHSPKNGVTWLTDRAGLRFGKAGTAFGYNGLNDASVRDDEAASLEVWLQPERIWDSGTFLALYRPDVHRQFSVCQSQTDLELRTETLAAHRSETARFQVEDVFRRTSPAFIALTSDAGGTAVYIDGVMVRMAPRFHFSAADLAGRTIVGDSSRQTRSWRGKILGLAFYRQALTGEEVVNHYKSWIEGGMPELTLKDRPVALYVFDERRGDVTRSRIGSGALKIPEKYRVLDKIRLEPAWEEFEMSRSYFGAAEKNIIGFIPLGLCFYAYWSSIRPIRRPALATILLGTAVSFTIEFLQSFLPTRESGMTDLLTNTLGTALGVRLYQTKLGRTTLDRLSSLVSAVAGRIRVQPRRSGV